MSVFVVSNKTLQRVASIVANVYNGSESLIPHNTAVTIQEAFAICKGDVYQIARKLYMVNVKSVNYRYDENESTSLSKSEFGSVNPSDYILESATADSTYQAFASIQCWLYQSCEKPNPDNSKYYHAVAVLLISLAEVMGGSPREIREREQYKQSKWDE